LVTVSIPMTFKLRGGRKVIIVPDGGDVRAPAKPRPDNTLFAGWSGRIRWKRLLEEGRFRSAGEAGEAEGVTRSFVNHLLRLTLLAPLEELTKAMPSEWEEQCSAPPCLSTGEERNLT
jgi:hypothetical protein